MHAGVLWACVAGFLTGVLCASLTALSWPFAAFCAVLASAALILSPSVRSRKGAIIIVIVLVAFGLGLERVSLATQVANKDLVRRVGQKITIEGPVVEESDVRENGVRLTMRANRLIVGSSSIPVSGGILVLAPPFTDAAYGDVIRASGELRVPASFDAGEGRTFNYPLYLAKDGVLFQLAFARTENIGEHQGDPLKGLAIGVKHAYLRGLQAVLPEPEAGFAGGITVGDKRSIGSELSAVFQRVSLIHMVVLSGYNITVVINSAARILSFAGRNIQLGGSAFVVIFFIFMAGGASSAVRAGAMALLAMYARVSGRTFLALRALGVTCAAMVLWNPLTLVYDPSFQLSALATGGLVLFTPLFFERLRWVPERLGLREIVSSTLGTQLAVLPLLLYQNGNLSLVALPANLFALLPVPFAMFFSFVAALAGMLFGSFATFIALPAYALLWYIISVAEVFGSIPFASVSVPAFSAWWMIGAYAVLAALYVSLKKKTTEPGSVVST